MKVYTKTGDKGITSLAGGKRVRKDSQRIETYGTVDELIAFIANLIDHLESGNNKNFLIDVEDKLMIASSILSANDKEILDKLPKLSDDNIKDIENEIDKLDNDLRPLRNFVLPGGSKSISACHMARTVCRRAEREIIRLSEIEEIDYLIVRYVNRLSDYLFTLSRMLHVEYDIPERIWKV